MNCWGWATWNNRWQHFQRDPARLLLEFTPEHRSRFNADNAHNFFAQIEANANGRLKTWAIFWYATIFRQNGLCLNPAQSLVANIGHDGTGENCRAEETETVLRTIADTLALPTEFAEHQVAFKRIQQHLHRSPLERVISRFKRLLQRSK